MWQSINYCLNWAWNRISWREGSLPIRIEDYEKMAAKLSIGEITLHDIVHELRRPEGILEKICRSRYSYGCPGNERPEAGDDFKRNRQKRD